MRILVLSDSHGRAGLVEEIVEKYADIAHVFFLGDVLRDVETAALLYPQKHFYRVAGNCDRFAADCACEALVTLGGVTVFYCHGHTLGVKYGLQGLMRQAGAQGAQLALYGHTHRANIDFQPGLCLVNPGSVSQARGGRNGYAVIDLQAGSILPTLVEL